MEEVYGSTNKVLIDSEGSGNLLYLPLDRLLEGAGQRQTSQELSRPTEQSRNSTQDRQFDTENRERRTRQ